jgi:ribonuclease VapC
LRSSLLRAASYLECGIVLDSQRDPVVSRSLDELLAEAAFVIEPVTEQHARLARQAYADFGRGSGDRAGLNFGDCLSYALALDTREPLLWKGGISGTRVLHPRSRSRCPETPSLHRAESLWGAMLLSPVYKR